jgi:hypothetical protein
MEILNGIGVKRNRLDTLITNLDNRLAPLLHRGFGRGAEGADRA